MGEKTARLKSVSHPQVRALLDGVVDRFGSREKGDLLQEIARCLAALKDGLDREKAFYDEIGGLKRSLERSGGRPTS